MNCSASFCKVGKDRMALLRLYIVLRYHHKHNAHVVNQMKKVHYVATTVNPRYYYHGKLNKYGVW